MSSLSLVRDDEPSTPPTRVTILPSVSGVHLCAYDREQTPVLEIIADVDSCTEELIAFLVHYAEGGNDWLAAALRSIRYAHRLSP